MARAIVEARIGCSGWHYRDWIGAFYPPKTPARALLAVYARHFSAVEINASFYRLPTAETVARWRATVPEGFLFAWKGSRSVTHRRTLDETGEGVARVMARAALLGPACGPILWQLPPRLGPDRERLARFLALLPKARRHVVEFRHPGWYEAGILDLLGAEGVALCLSDHADAPAPVGVTARHVYLRLHGPGGRYTGNYSDKALVEWATRIADWQRDGHDVFVFFDNDQRAAAPRDARRLIRLVGSAGGRAAVPAPQRSS